MNKNRLKEVIRNIIKPHPGKGKKFFQYSFLRSDGSFDYELYKRIQVAGNKRKIDRVWVRESSIILLSNYIKNKIENPTFGICHGTRRGLEQKWFKEHLGCEVIGTEISDTAQEFENSIQWDFHEENPEWIGAVDFVYSNSFDHAHDPEKALTVWMRSLKPGGICIIEHTESHGVKHSTPLDPFGANLEIMPYLVLKWSKGLFSVREILHEPSLKKDENERYFLIIQNNIPA